VITHRLPWQDYEQGFAAMRSGDAAKVVLDWQV
jgi:threonine 3-dehydrogenase